MKTYDELKKIVTGKGYKFFEGDLNINLIGVRKENLATNEWDDELYVAMEIGGQRQVFYFADFTTDPGYYYLKKKHLNKKGCAILKPGQYRGMWTYGLHRGKYAALINVTDVTVYRDRNKDNTFDTKVEDTGRFGINHHHGYDSEDVDKNSAGCQVHKLKAQLAVILALCHLSSEKYGNSFSYTLLMKSDLK